jgi:hypothetical protein
MSTPTCSRGESAILGEEQVFGDPGDLVFKPRNQWHPFRNDGEEPAAVLEIISPGGLEHLFAHWGALPSHPILMRWSRWQPRIAATLTWN